MVFDFYTKKIKVFVAEVSEDTTLFRDNLLLVLNRAGMEVLSLNQSSLEHEEALIGENSKLLAMADCSVHLIGGQSIKSNLGIGNQSVIEYQLQEARNKKDSEWRDFKIFIWHPSQFSASNSHTELDEFISSIRQGIMHNMIYSNRDTAVSFVEDIRSVMYGGREVQLDTDEADIFFIYNALDYDAANDVLSLVADVAKVKVLEINLSEDVDYSELVAQQIKKSKQVVIYFKDTSDWSLPFVQQVWKRVGGASSDVPILFIGDSSVEENEKIEFEAPLVTVQIIAAELIPLEIKVHFDKIT